MKFENRFLAWIAVGASLTTALTLGAVVAFNSPARTFNVTASSDAYLSSFAPATNYGAAKIIWVSNSGGFENWTLIQFGISGRLRPGDLVVNARMHLTIVDANAASWPVVVITGRTVTAWQENNTTFSTAPSFSFDTSTATAVGISGVPSPGAVVSIDVTKQLHRWQSYGGPSNFGTLIKIAPDAARASIGFASRENSDFGKPVLEVTFQPGPRTPYGYGVGPPPITIAAARTD